MKYILVLCTINDYEKAKEIANILLEGGLIACSNIIPNITSIYRWEGEVCEDSEYLILMKTKSSCFAKLRAEIVKLHPYEVPEIISVNIEDGLDTYLKWISDSVKA